LLTETQTEARSVRWQVAWVVAALAAAIVIRILYLRFTDIYLDEYQHLHAAYLVGEGQVPYRDFLEHHTPFFYFLAAPFIAMSQKNFDTILNVRMLSLAFSSLSVFVGWLWARKLYGERAAWLVAALMLGSFFLFYRGSFLFLDTFATPFLLLSGLLLPVQRSDRRSAFFSGLCYGVAILFTQKAVMSIFAPAFIWVVLLAQRRKGIIADLAFYGLGGAASLLILLALIGPGTIGDFFQQNVTWNLAWKAKRFPRPELISLAGTDGVVALIAVYAAIRRLVLIGRRRLQLVPADVPALYFLSLLAGIFLLPVVWVEYFVEVVNFGTIVAGLLLVELLNLQTPEADDDAETGLRIENRALFLAAAVILILIRFSGLGARWVVADAHRAMSTPAALAAASILLAAIVLIFRAVNADRPIRPALLMTAILVYPVVQQLDYIYRAPNDSDRIGVEQVLRLADVDEPVFDGYSGFGVFRPHVYQYWFLHDELQLMMTEEQLGPGVVDAIESSRAPVVINDRFVAMLPDTVHSYLRTHYEPTDVENILVRRERQRPD